MKSKKGFQFFPFPEKIMGTSIFSISRKNHGNINFFHFQKKSWEHQFFTCATCVKMHNALYDMIVVYFSWTFVSCQ